jgi:hypothetical protein
MTEQELWAAIYAQAFSVGVGHGPARLAADEAITALREGSFTPVIRDESQAAARDHAWAENERLRKQLDKVREERDRACDAARDRELMQRSRDSAWSDRTRLRNERDAAEERCRVLQRELERAHSIGRGLVSAAHATIEAYAEAHHAPSTED